MTYPRDRELRLRTIQGVKDLLSSSGSMAPERDAIYVESNGYSAWFVALAQEQPNRAPISNEEILRRLEAREALQGHPSNPASEGPEKSSENVGTAGEEA